MQDRMTKLAFKIADESARSLVDSEHVLVRIGDVFWLQKESEDGLPECVREALAYLKLRGLYQAHPVREEIFTVLLLEVAA